MIYAWKSLRSLTDYTTSEAFFADNLCESEIAQLGLREVRIRGKQNIFRPENNVK